MSDNITLITGGTGSFGKTMAARLLETGCDEIRILSRDEWKQDEMRQRFDDDRLKYYIGDVRDRSSVDSAMGGVKRVFHAAALKQVPSCEFFPMQAVETNVRGSHNVIESAVAHGVESVVCLGTDKAVGPVNAMGMTKALMEKVAQAAARHLGPGDTTISSVRYGNVMYSRGSVIPLFVRQLLEGEDITVTDPEMTRFMLPLRDSVALVEFAFTEAGQGDIFIKKAPACTIATLVEALKRLLDKPDAEVKVIGTRHGEKIHETLASAEELCRADDMGDYYRIRMDARNLNYAKFFTEGEPERDQFGDYASDNTGQLDVEGTMELLLSLPEIQELGVGKTA